MFPLQSSVNFKKRAAAYIGNGVETRASRMASLNTKFYFIFFFPPPSLSLPLTFAIDRFSSLLFLRVDPVDVPLSVDNQIPPKLRGNAGTIGLAVGDDCSALTDSNSIHKGEDAISFRSIVQNQSVSQIISLLLFSLSLSRKKKIYKRMKWENAKRGRREKTKKIEAEGNIAEGTL